MTSAGVALAAAGPDAFRRIGHLTLSYGGYALLATAALLVFIRVVPRNARITPVVLALGGLALLGLRHRSAWYAHRWALVGALLVLAGVGLATRPARPARQHAESKWPTPYQRELCLLPRTVDIKGKFGTPTILTLTAVAGRLKVNLAEAEVPVGYGMEIFVRCALGGAVELRFPADWAVAAGRLSAAHRIAWDDKFEFDSPELFVDPRAEGSSKTLFDLAKNRREATPDSKIRATGVWVVVHVAGLGGSVRISR